MQWLRPMKNRALVARDEFGVKAWLSWGLMQGAAESAVRPADGLPRLELDGPPDGIHCDERKRGPIYAKSPATSQNAAHDSPTGRHGTVYWRHSTRPSKHFTAMTIGARRSPELKPTRREYHENISECANPVDVFAYDEGGWHIRGCRKRVGVYLSIMPWKFTVPRGPRQNRKTLRSPCHLIGSALQKRSERCVDNFGFQRLQSVIKSKSLKPVDDPPLQRLGIGIVAAFLDETPTCEGREDECTLCHLPCSRWGQTLGGVIHPIATIAPEHATASAPRPQRRPHSRHHPRRRSTQVSCQGRRLCRVHARHGRDDIDISHARLRLSPDADAGDLPGAGPRRPRPVNDQPTGR